MSLKDNWILENYIFPNKGNNIAEYLLTVGSYLVSDGSYHQMMDNYLD